MNKAFTIAPSLFTIPNIGFVDTRKEISDELAFKIYRISRRVFPKASLGPDAEAFLKKQKLDVKEFGKLVANAQTKDEIELLAKISDTKTIDRIAEVKIQALENTKVNL